MTLLLSVGVALDGVGGGEGAGIVLIGVGGGEGEYLLAVKMLTGGDGGDGLEYNCCCCCCRAGEKFLCCC